MCLGLTPKRLAISLRDTFAAASDSMKVLMLRLADRVDFRGVDHDGDSRKVIGEQAPQPFSIVSCKSPHGAFQQAHGVFSATIMSGLNRLREARSDGSNGSSLRSRVAWALTAANGSGKPRRLCRLRQNAPDVYPAGSSGSVSSYCSALRS